jgi:hypothetical protein
LIKCINKLDTQPQWVPSIWLKHANNYWDEEFLEMNRAQFWLYNMIRWYDSKKMTRILIFWEFWF